MNRAFDVIVIGAGPAGYHAAIRCAQHGLNTACIDKSLDKRGNPTLGGTCLNWGCIPSKALLDISHKYDAAAKDYDRLGIELSNPKVNVKKMMAFKDGVVRKLTGGVKALLNNADVTVLHGAGTLQAANKISYRPQDGDMLELTAKQVILAPGSAPVEIAAAPLIDDLVVDSTGALEFTKVPKRLGVIGSGIIGLELGSVWNRLGSQVILLEALDTFLPMVDAGIAKDVLRIFKRQGLDVRLSSRVLATERSAQGISLQYSDANETHSLEFDKLIVAVGRQPYTEGLLSDDCGVQLDERGFIYVDERCQTDAYEVYAIGDAVRGPMLAHKGMEEGLMVADRLVGRQPLVNYDLVPSVIYSAPEVAWVGQTEDEAKASGEPYKTSSFPFSANGRALAGDATEGMVKLVVHAETDRILGVHVLGAQASELIAQAVIALEFDASAEDLGLVMFAHPSLSESLHEAALGANGEAVHAINTIKRKSQAGGPQAKRS